MKIMYRGCLYESIENNSTLLVYHGTDVVFSSFKKTAGTIRTIFGGENVKRDGFFFATNKKFAEEFGHNIITCELTVNNILDMRYGVSNEDDIEKLVNVGVNERYMRNLEPSIVWTAFDGDDSIAPYIIKAGYDCVEMVEANRYGVLETVYVVFDESKIKILPNILHESQSNDYASMIIKSLKELGYSDSITSYGAILAYHGTSKANIKSILKSMTFKGHPWFALDENIARRYAQTKGSSYDVMPVLLDPNSVSITGGYLTARSEGLTQKGWGSSNSIWHIKDAPNILD